MNVAEEEGWSTSTETRIGVCVQPQGNEWGGSKTKKQSLLFDRYSSVLLMLLDPIVVDFQPWFLRPKLFPEEGFDSLAYWNWHIGILGDWIMGITLDESPGQGKTEFPTPLRHYSAAPLRGIKINLGAKTISIQFANFSCRALQPQHHIPSIQHDNMLIRTPTAHP